MSRAAPYVVAAAALAVLLVGCVFVQRDAVAGWLIGFVFWAGVVLGSLALAMIHRLTGGGWYATLEPAPSRLAALSPMLLVAFLPVAVSIGLLFHWEPARPSVATFWLNAPGYVARSVVLLMALAGAAFWLRRSPASLLAPALGLCLYGLAVSVFAVDWVLALRRETMFTAFGAFLAVQQLATATSFAILCCPSASRAREDVAELLLAYVAGALYLAFMDFLVAWYGDVPARVAWYVARSSGPWLAVVAAAFVFAALVPIVLLLASRTRLLSTPLRTVCLSVLIGMALYDTWLIAPSVGPLGLVFGAAALLLGGVLALAAVWIATRPREAGHG